MSETQPTTYYKVLVNGRSCHGGDYAWPLPRENADGSWTPGDWTPKVADVAVCRRGWHLTTEPFRWHKSGWTVYEAEGRGAQDDNGDDKAAFAQARLMRPWTPPAWWANVETFIASLADVPWLRPDGNPDPAWRLFTAPTWDAAWDAAGAAAWDAAWDAAKDAAGDAARAAAGDAAWDAAIAAAWNAAWDAARAAAGAAAWDAAWDAALYARVLVCDGLSLAPEHRAHAEARMNVWRKGFCLLCDVDGVLYVYAQEA